MTKNVTNLTSYSLNDLTTSKKAFTLAEVLITLGIIGVVAATLIPTLINIYQDKIYDFGRKKILATVREANKILASNNEINSAVNSEDFTKNYLGKTMRIIKTCDSTNLTECGIPKTFKSLNNTITMTMPTTKYYGFLTANGFSINVYYNSECASFNDADNVDISNFVCANMIYDVNNLKAPNQVGKDIGFITLLYPDITNITVSPPISTYKTIFGSYNNNDCSGGYRVPTKEELFSIIFNKSLIGFSGLRGNLILSSSVNQSGLVIGITQNNNLIYPVVKHYLANYLCIDKK